VEGAGNGDADRAARERGLVVFGERWDATSRGNIHFSRIAPLLRSSTKHCERWNGAAPSHVTPQPNRPLVWILISRKMKKEHLKSEEKNKLN